MSLAAVTEHKNSAENHPDSWYLATANEHVGFDSLKESKICDVCVVGGGYTGLSSALHLAERGYNVVLLEASRIGWGASGRNGGQLGSGQRKHQDELEKMVGEDAARQLWDIAEASKRVTLQLINQHNIDCDLKQGIAYPDHKRSYVKSSRAYTEKLKMDYGNTDVEYLCRPEMSELLGTNAYHGGMLDHGGWHLHPLNLALGLAKAAVDAGVVIYESTRVLDYREGQRVEIKTSSGTIDAEHLVLGCNGYLGKLDKRLTGRIMPINNFIIATEPLDEATVKRINPKDVAVADSRFVINYYRLSGDRRLLFGGGENYSSTFPGDIKSFVRKPMLRIYPDLKDVRIDYGWGGTLAVTMNRMPHFGRLGNGKIYFAQGYSGHGVGLAILAGKLIGDALAGDSKQFDVMANIPTPAFPGGTLLRYPALVLGMSYYALRDRLQLSAPGFKSKRHL